MRNSLLLMLFCSLTIAKAQVPGYMGKRFSLFVEANPTPAVFVQNYSNQVTTNLIGAARTSDINPFAYNFRPQVTVEYLVHRDISVGLSYSRIMMGTIRGYSPDPLSTDYIIDQDVIKGQGLGVHVKRYGFENSASIAPIGFYQTLSVYITQTNTYDTKKSKAKQFRDDFLYPVASISIGRQSMILNNLILKTGVEIGWAFVPTNFISEVSDEWTVQEYAGYNVHQSLAGYYLFNINVALAYTLF